MAHHFLEVYWYKII